MSTPLPRVHAFMVGSHEPVLYWLWHKVDQAKWIAPFSTTICLQYMWHKVDQAKWIAPFSTTIFVQYMWHKVDQAKIIAPFSTTIFVQYFFFFSHRAPIKGWMPTIIPTWEKVKPMVIERTGVSTGLACRTLKRCCTKFCPPKFHHQTKPRVLGCVMA